MHIPDAVLSPAVAAATSVVAAGGLAVCLWKLKHHLAERTPVLMGVMSAFVFAAQMVNFPLYPLPISGHLLGGVLSAVLLGPWAGAVVIAAVLIVQCLLFGDGGVTALGANFVNMGLIGSIGGYAIYAPLRRAMRRPRGHPCRRHGRGVVLGAPGFGSLRRRAGRLGPTSRFPQRPGVDGAGARGDRDRRGADHRDSCSDSCSWSGLI